jgi:hypothetical protein
LIDFRHYARYGAERQLPFSLLSPLLTFSLLSRHFRHISSAAASPFSRQCRRAPDDAAAEGRHFRHYAYAPMLIALRFRLSAAMPAAFIISSYQAAAFS